MVFFYCFFFSLQLVVCMRMYVGGSWESGGMQAVGSFTFACSSDAPQQPPAPSPVSGHTSHQAGASQGRGAVPITTQCIKKKKRGGRKAKRVAEGRAPQHQSASWSWAWRIAGFICNCLTRTNRVNVCKWTKLKRVKLPSTEIQRGFCFLSCSCGKSHKTLLFDFCNCTK